MDAQLVVIVAGAVLVLAILGSLIFMRSYSGRFTFDTKNGTQPKAARGDGNTTDQQMKGRFQILTFGVGAALVALVAKVWSMQLVSSDYYEELSEQNRTRTVTTAAPRGRILDRDGVELVTNRASLGVAAYRTLSDDTVTVRHLANVLGLPYISVMRNIEDYSQSAQSLHTIATDVRRSTVAYIQEHPTQFEGISILESTERVYPYGSMACHILGYTGTITQEQLDAQEEKQNSGDDEAGDVTYQSGDVVGQAGVESQYESLLQGIPGEQTVRVDSSGNVLGMAGSVDPSPGSDIKLTISLKIQQACEDAVQKGIEAGQGRGYASEAAAVVCLDCTNGEVLGLASYPNYDPSVFVGGVSEEVWSTLNSEEAGTPMVDRAIAGQYMSASTIKAFSSLAGLEYGMYTSSQTSACAGWWTGLGESAGRWCWNHSGHGYINLRNGIVQSCDAVFYDIGKAFFYADENNEGLQEMFRRYGLGSTTGIDLPGEAAGRVPDAEWKEGYFTEWTDEQRAWNAGDMLNIVIGQGDILVSPLQMACAYMGVANNGVEYVPHVFLSAIARDGEGDATSYKVKKRLSAKVHSQADMDLVHDGLKGVVYEESASITKHFTNLPVTVCGKTGTGEKEGQDDYAWFVCYAPAEDPKYVIAALIEQGGYGETAGVAAARTVLAALYDTPDTETYTTGGSSR